MIVFPKKGWYTNNFFDAIPCWNALMKRRWLTIRIIVEESSSSKPRHIYNQNPGFYSGTSHIISVTLTFVTFLTRATERNIACAWTGIQGPYYRCQAVRSWFWLWWIDQARAGARIVQVGWCERDSMKSLSQSRSRSDLHNYPAGLISSPSVFLSAFNIQKIFTFASSVVILEGVPFCFAFN